MAQTQGRGETIAQNHLIDILALDGLASIACGSTNVGYSPFFALPKNMGALGLMLKFTSSGSVDVKVELEQGNTVPTDQAADTSWAVGDTISTGVTATTAQCLVVEPVATKYARLKVTGQGSNHATTVLARAEIVLAKGY